jgi:hypothetical protein
VHREVQRFDKEGYDILLVGHEGHEEVEGTAGEAPDAVQLVDGPEGIAKATVRDPKKVIWLSQTTLSVDETMETVIKLREKFPTLQNPPSDDICYATQNRQVAIKKVGAESDLVIVVGSANSSNTVRLVEVALDAGAKAAYRVDDASEIQESWTKDCKIDQLNLGPESTKTPELHSKYLNILSNSKLQLRKAEADYYRLRRTKMRYYRGELTREELEEHGWNQYQGLKPLKNEMDDVLQCDEEMIKQQDKIDYIKAVLYQLEQILRSLNSRTWDIKSAIEWTKFTNGLM